MGEEVTPENGGYELQEGDDVEWADSGSWGLAVEEEVEEAETDGVALVV